MTIEIGKKELDEIVIYLESGRLVENMNNMRLSASAMIFVLQTIVHEVAKARKNLNTEKN